MYNVKEIAKENEFVRNAKQIKEIAIENKCDVGVALDMYCAKEGINYTPYTEKQKEFLNLCRVLTLNVIIEELK